MAHIKPKCVIANKCTPGQARENYNNTVTALVLALSNLGYTTEQIASCTDELLAITQKLIAPTLL